MKKYIGVKIVEAAPMTLGHYNDYKGWTIPVDEDPDREGYRVHYSDGYVCWSPKEIFEEANKEITGLPFGHAIEALKNGIRVARSGWNGKGMFVCKQVPSFISGHIVPKIQSLPQSAKDEFQKRFDLDPTNAGINYCNQMIIVKSDNTIDSWVPSSSDTLAEDWIILD